MKKAQKMARLATLADLQQREAGTALAEAIKLHQKHERQLLELKQYRHEYARPLSTTNSASINAAQAQQIAAFLVNLDAIIGTMESQVQGFANDVQNKDLDWREKQQRATSFDGLAQAYVAVAQQQISVRQDLAIEEAWQARVHISSR